MEVVAVVAEPTDKLLCAAYAGTEEPATNTYPFVPIANLDNTPEADAYKMSPVVYELMFVPPWATANVPEETCDAAMLIVTLPADTN